MDIEKAFESFKILHGGTMKQSFNSLLYVRPKANLEDFIYSYLDRLNSNIVIFLMIRDKAFIEKITSFMTR